MGLLESITTFIFGTFLYRSRIINEDDQSDNKNNNSDNNNNSNNKTDESSILLSYDNYSIPRYSSGVEWILLNQFVVEIESYQYLRD
jgi:hypothetical protein